MGVGVQLFKEFVFLLLILSTSFFTYSYCFFPLNFIDINLHFCSLILDKLLNPIEINH